MHTQRKGNDFWHCDHTTPDGVALLTFGNRKSVAESNMVSAICKRPTYAQRRVALEKAHVGDAQGFYNSDYELRLECGLPITDDHIQAYQIEHQPVPARPDF